MAANYIVEMMSETRWKQFGSPVGSAYEARQQAALLTYRLCKAFRAACGTCRMAVAPQVRWDRPWDGECRCHL